MPRYLIEASYTTEGVKGVQRAGGTSRREAISRMVEGLGGRLESLDFAFGGNDVYAIAELPDNETAAAVAMTVNGSGAVTARTVVLLTPELVDAAAQRSVDYAPPGS